MPPRGTAQYRPATPNSRGQYSASVMEELESQNDAQVEGLSAKVKMLKEVCFFPPVLFPTIEGEGVDMLWRRRGEE